MKLVTFEINGRSAVGLLNADATAVHPVPGCADMQTLIGLWPALDTVAMLRSAVRYELDAKMLILSDSIGVRAVFQAAEEDQNTKNQKIN